MTQVIDTSSRFHRQNLITWWDQDRLQMARVLVVGAGALGNEVVKNLALVGVGEIQVCDMDAIENSNLSRCVFFRESDLGQNKAAVLASRADEVYSEVSVSAITLPVQRLGVAYLSKFDLVIGALDNREARAWVNQACRKLGKTWVDGAIEGLRGVARVFPPEGACYLCTLSEADFKQMSHRRSCALLSPEDLLEGKTPTNATTASIIAGVQVQEAIKFLSGGLEMVSLKNKAWVFTGDSMDAYVTSYREDEYCMAHDSYDSLLEVGDTSTYSLVDAFSGVLLSADEEVQAIDFEEELVTFGACKNCDDGFELVGLRSSLPLGVGRCSACGGERPGTMESSIFATHPAVKKSVAELGFALEDVLTIRTETRRIHLKVSGKIG